MVLGGKSEPLDLGRGDDSTTSPTPRHGPPRRRLHRRWVATGHPRCARPTTTNPGPTVAAPRSKAGGSCAGTTTDASTTPTTSTGPPIRGGSASTGGRRPTMESLTHPVRFSRGRPGGAGATRVEHGAMVPRTRGGRTPRARRSSGLADFGPCVSSCDYLAARTRREHVSARSQARGYRAASARARSARRGSTCLVLGGPHDAVDLVTCAISDVSRRTGLKFEYDGLTGARPRWKSSSLPFFAAHRPALVSWAIESEVELAGRVAGIGGSLPQPARDG